jgi:hypothetical protein
VVRWKFGNSKKTENPSRGLRHYLIMKIVTVISGQTEEKIKLI